LINLLQSSQITWKKTRRNKCTVVMQPAQRWCTQGLPTVTFAAPITSKICVLFLVRVDLWNFHTSKKYSRKVDEVDLRRRKCWSAFLLYTNTSHTHTYIHSLATSSTHSACALTILSRGAGDQDFVGRLWSAPPAAIKNYKQTPQFRSFFQQLTTAAYCCATSTATPAHQLIHTHQIVKK
jgi:hypothetical protein